jgi:coatomer subunit beta
MLIHLDQSKALDYLNSCLDQISSFNDILQLVIVELIYKVCIANPSERSRFIRAIYNLLNTSTSPSVRYEAAATLITLSQAPTALKAAANCFIDICLKESDNNVKLIVLDRLIGLKESAPAAEKVLQESLMDILRILTVATDLEVKNKILKLSLELVSPRNSEEMVHLLKKEVIKTQNESITSNDETGKYRVMLVKTLHSICIKFPEVLSTNHLLSTLNELLSADDDLTAQLVIGFYSEFMIKNANTKDIILDKILEIMPSVRNVKVLQCILWILGEFCDGENVSQIQEVRKIIRDCLGPMPIVETELKSREEGNETIEVQSNTTTNAIAGNKLVTADGSYATQSALSVTTVKKSADSNLPSLRAALFSGSYFTATSLANCLVKLVFKLKHVVDASTFNSFNAECMLILASILHLGKSKLTFEDSTTDVSINEDDFERVAVCLQVLSQISQTSPEVEQLMNTIFITETRKSLTAMIDASETTKEETKEKKPVKKYIETDDHLSFTQLLSRNQEMFENQFEISLSQAIGGNTGPTATSSTFGKVSTISDLLSTSKLSKVTQLTGFSDPVYAECYVNVNQFDICLDVLIVNQTNDILQNCTLELSTMGDLKLVEKPQAIVLAPHDFANIKASVKVASTENGVIFGNIAYDVSGSTSDRNVVVLNDIHIDIMDYILPASCTDTQFRTMWAEFEWENKVTVNTQITDLQEFLSFIIKSTNMKCLTPQKALSGDCSFLAANLYAKSIFGEDALANVSIEKTPDSPVTGHIRIRAKSQGMALSLGDKINVTQRSAKHG